MDDSLKQKVVQLPMTPGVYIYKNKEGEIIYVGKAKSLKNRVSSYFQSGILPGTKTFALVSRINDLEYIKVETELEAIILEAELIKKHQPKYNIIQKDDRSYLYIVLRKISHEVAGNKFDLLNIITERESDLDNKDTIYGPYPDGRIAREILRKIRLLFPFKDCSQNKFSRYYKMNRPCLYGQLKLCPAPCVKNTDIDLQKSSEIVKDIKKLLSGKSVKIIAELEKKMITSSEAKDFESAIYYRDLLRKFKYVSNSVRSPDLYMENPYLMDDIAKSALSDIVAMIPLLTSPPNRIECYDISNISGKESVGSMVVATNGHIDKAEYKRFKIKLSDTPNDFGMLAEVLGRRLKHSIENPDVQSWPKPDLLLIDGGKGQVNAVMQVVTKLGLKIPVVGIAKRFESLVYVMNDVYVEARFSKSGEGLKLLIRLRDEAHRFAQSYHHLLREKKLDIAVNRIKAREN